MPISAEFDGLCWIPIIPVLTSNMLLSVNAEIIHWVTDRLQLIVLKLDLPLSEVFYKWMLGQEHTLQADDLRHICPIFAKSFVQLTDVLQQKKRIEADKSHVRQTY